MGVVRKLAAPGAPIKDLAVSPDGERVAFVTLRKRFDAVQIVSLTGPDSFRIHAVERRAVVGLNWNPTGTRIVYAEASISDEDRVERGTTELWSMSGRGKQVSRLTRDGRDDFDPVVTPDGKRVVFSRSAARSVDLFSMAIDGGRKRRITSTKAGEYVPAVSPDGRRLAYAQNAGKGRARLSIKIAGIDGSDPVTVRRGAGNDYEPAFSPDGSRLVFFSDRDDAKADGNYFRDQLYASDADGTGVKRLLKSRFADRQPVYVPRSPKTR